jgi:hypothetical protein
MDTVWAFEVAVSAVSATAIPKRFFIIRIVFLHVISVGGGA